MSGTMRKMGVYLGLLEDAPGNYGAEYVDDEAAYEEPARREPVPAAARETAPAPREVSNLADRRRTGATGPAPSAVVAPMSRITTLHPRTYNEARTIGEHFREGIPVIMNLTDMDDSDAKRLVDFSAGLVFGMHGSIERVTNKVFLLSPPNVTVAAADKQRIAEGGFFNQS